MLRLRERPAKTVPFEGDPVPDRLALSAVRRNLVVGADGTYAWFRLAPVQWKYKTPDQQKSFLSSLMLRLSELVGHRIHGRRTSHPFPSWLHAEDLDKRTKNPFVKPDGSWSFASVNTDAQLRMQQLRAGKSATYFGVRFARRLTAEELDLVAKPARPDNKELQKIVDELWKVTRVVKADGLRGTPLDARTFGLLVQQSVALGVPVAPSLLAGDPNRWDERDWLSFVTSVHTKADPGDSTVEVKALRNGAEYRSEVAVLSLERIEGRPDEPSDHLLPWLCGGDMMDDFTPEWSFRCDILAGEDVTKDAEATQNRAESLAQHVWEMTKRKPTPANARAIQRAEDILDEVTSGPPAISTRVRGTFHVAVTGQDKVEVLDRVSQLTGEYAKYQKASLNHSLGQHRLARMFVPGEPDLLPDGFQHQMPAYFLAQAAPQVATVLGDGVGPYLGMSAHTPVCHDPLTGPRMNRPGMFFIGGIPGAGKSTLAGVLMFWAMLRGWDVLLNDPSGALSQAMVKLFGPEVARTVELSSAAPGTLVPHTLIADPDKDDYKDPKDYHEAKREAAGERMDLLIDALTGLLMPGTRELPGAAEAIESAVLEAGGDYGLNPWVVVKKLQKRAVLDQDGKVIAGELPKSLGDYFEKVSRTRGVALIFPADKRSKFVKGNDSLVRTRFTGLTMSGISPGDPALDQKHWTRAQRLAVPILQLASYYSLRFMKSSKRPKLIINDELGISATGDSSHTAFLVRGSRDSRKTNTAFGMLGQNPEDQKQLSNQIANLMGCVFMGRIEDAETAASALPMLKVATGVGHEDTLAALPSGSFLYSDFTGHVDVVDVDIEYLPFLKEALDTTPVEDKGDFDEDDWERELMRAWAA